MRKILIIIFFLVLLPGCGTSKRAQLALSNAEKINQEVREAFFVKAWALNRALITESREKWVAMAKLLSPTTDSNDIIDFLNKNIGEDEKITSENFAYLSYLLISGEKSNEFSGQVDFYLESKKPFLKILYDKIFKNTKDLGSEKEKLSMWDILIEDFNEGLGY